MVSDYLLSRRNLVGAMLLASAAPIKAFAQTAVSSPVPIRGGTFIMALDPEPTELNVSFHNQYANAVVGSNMFEGLLGYDNSQNALPGLATSWVVSPDGKTITFKLRSGVKWHDGEAFTSADVRYNVLEVWKKVHPRGRITFAPVADVETPDALTAVFQLTRPAPVILNSLDAAEAPLLPAHLYQGTDVRTNPANAKPIGTGAFRFKQWVKGQYIELERNPDYWDSGKPYLDKVVIRTIPDPAARAAALETGEVMYVPYAGVPFSDVARLRKEPGLVYQPKGYAYNAQIYFLEFNLRRQYSGNLQVRRAIAQAINKQGLVDTVWYGISEPVDGPIPPSLSAYYTEDKPSYPFDVAAANKLLDQAGLKRNADGVRFSLTLTLSPSSDAFPAAGEYIRQNLQKIGIDIKPVAPDVATYLRQVYTNYDFDVILQPYSVLFDPEMGITRVLWSKGASPGVPYVNASGYASPAMDQIIESYQKEVDPAKRVALFHDLQKVELTDLPLIPLMDAPFFSFYSSKVHGINIDPDGARSSLKNVGIST